MTTLRNAPNMFSIKQTEQWNSQRLRLTSWHIPQKICNHIGTSCKSRPKWDYREKIWLQRFSKNEWTSMDKLNMQWTCPPVPGMEITCRNWHTIVNNPQRKPKDIRAIYVKAVFDIRPKNRNWHKKTNWRRKYHRLSRRSQHIHIIFNHNETTCKQRHIRPQIRIHMHWRQIFLFK